MIKSVVIVCVFEMSLINLITRELKAYVYVLTSSSTSLWRCSSLMFALLRWRNAHVLEYTQCLYSATCFDTLICIF